MKIKNFRIIVVICLFVAMLSGCGMLNGVSDEEVQSSELTSELTHNYTPVFSGWSEWAGGPDYTFKVSTLMDENGNAVTDEMCDIKKCTDSYGFPIWFCIYYGRHGYTNSEIFAADGSWKHMLHGEGVSFNIDENGLLCIESTSSDSSYSIDFAEPTKIESGMNVVYKIGNDVILTESKATEKITEINHSGVWDSSNRILSYNGTDVQLPDYITEADYEINRIIGKFNGIKKSIYWDGNIFAESSINGLQYLFDASGENVIIEGIHIDRIEDKATHKIYYTAIGNDGQLRVYSNNGEYITDLKGRFVAECWDGVFWTVSKDESEIEAIQKKDYEIYSKSVTE